MAGESEQEAVGGEQEREQEVSVEELEERRHREWMRKLSSRGMGYGNAATEVREEQR